MMRIKRLLIILFMMTSPIGMNSQKVNFDSLKRVILSSDSDSLRMSAYYDYSFNICYKYPDSGVYYARKVLDLARKRNFPNLRLNAFSQIGYSYNLKGDLDSSVYYWGKALNICDSLSHERRKAILLTNIAANLILLGQYDSAKENLEKANKILYKLDSTDKMLASVYINLGLLYDEQGDYFKGLENYQKAYDLSEKLGYEYGMGNACENISVMYYYAEKYKDVIYYGKKALNHYEDDKYFSNRCNVYINIAVGYDMTGHKDSAVYYNKLALECNKSIGNNFNVAKVYHNLGALFSDKGEIEKALGYLMKAEEVKKRFGLREGIATTYNWLGHIYTIKKEFALARKYLKKAAAIGEKLNQPEDIKDNRKFWAEYYEAKKDYKQAYYWIKKWEALKDSLLNKSHKDKLAQLELQYQTARMKAKNNRLLSEKKLKEATIQSQWNYIIAGTVGFGVLALMTLLLLRQNALRRKVNEQLKSQRDQIHLLNRELNHRVKNNLAFMTSLLEMQGRRTDSVEARQVLRESESRLKALSLIHSNLFKNSKDTRINLASYLEEIMQHLQDVFELPGKELHIVHDIAPYTIEAEDAMRIGLIINELITNSVKHAFSDVDHPEIKIQTTLDDSGRLILRYSDNGPGIKESVLLAPPPGEQNMGTKLISLLIRQLGGHLHQREKELVFTLGA